MPPRRHSSSSHSSRSHSSSHRSHSLSSHSSRSHSSSSYSMGNHDRLFLPKNTPKHIAQNSLHLTCKNHRYLYYPEDWRDETTGKYYNKGYYDENGTYYSANDIVFKNKDGSYKSHFECKYCGSEAEYTYQEGMYPNCNNCGAIMDKTPVYIDELYDISKPTVDIGIAGVFKFIGHFYLAFIGIQFGLFFIGTIAAFIMVLIQSHKEPEYTSEPSETTISNVDIYGTNLYLDYIGDNTYVLCNESDDYEKHLTWDYGYQSYYDYDSDCYIWYNTDVSPNLWQYWYESIAGNNDYGWMECEGQNWYIESESGWNLYTGDTNYLWHIENRFDEKEDN